jgi:hypothetical protein
MPRILNLSKVTAMTISYDAWIDEIRSALRRINMPMEEWQESWRFDFEREYSLGTEASTAAIKANRYWWRKQNETINQECSRTPRCWLPRNHRGDCEQE